MQNPISGLLFIFFAVILFVMYIAIRRRWLPAVATSVVGIVASVIVMTLSAMAQGNTWLHAIFVGVLIGGLFSAGTLAIAFYFQRSEMRGVFYQPPPDHGEEDDS